MRYFFPEIKYISSTDWDLVENSGEKSLSIPIHIEIGDMYDKGIDFFDLLVINFWPNKENIGDSYIKHGDGWCEDRATLFLSEITMEKIRNFVQEKIDTLGPYESWPIFAERMSPYLKWEFEGMPYPPSW